MPSCRLPPRYKLAVRFWCSLFSVAVAARAENEGNYARDYEREFDRGFGEEQPRAGVPVVPDPVEKVVQMVAAIEENLTLENVYSAVTVFVTTYAAALILIAILVRAMHLLFRCCDASGAGFTKPAPLQCLGRCAVRFALCL